MKSKPARIYLSPPHMGDEEQRFVREAFESNYVAPLGPQVDAFEAEFARKVGTDHALAVSSGTAAMHLALRILGVGPGDEVFASSLTFIGSVTPVIFQGAIPVFIDCDRVGWNMDPNLLEQELERCAKKGKLPRAVIPTDLYGQCCDYDRIHSVCSRYGTPVVVDAAEALGARYRRGQRAESREQETETLQTRPEKTGLNSKFKTQNSEFKTTCHAGKGARAAVFSFNGNKIITTSGGGMLTSDDEELIAEARFLSQQARDPAPHYEHSTIGYNYRMSNIVAAIGRGQLRVLDERVEKKRWIFDYYRQALGDLPGIEFMPEAPYGRCTRWLTVILIAPEEFGADRERVRLALEEENIEARPVWKPMHLQPVFECMGAGLGAGGEGREWEAGTQVPGDKGKKYGARVVGGAVSEDLFERGLCLPSGTQMTEEDLDRVVSTIARVHRRR